MEVVTVTTKDTAGTATRIEQTTYDYNHTGIRVSALHKVDTDADGTFDERTLTEFLNDHRNHTGYSQVLRETHYDADTGLVTKTVDYTVGHDEISQTTRAYDAQGNVTSEETLVFAHDGHGSVRVLLDMAAAVVQFYFYEAYGQLLAIHNGAGTFVSANAADALTTVLYSGEQFDARIGQQYLRARWYNPANGRFNRLDPFFGTLTDPQSLHKYLYVHGDPVTFIDPTGEGLVAKIATFALRIALYVIGGSVGVYLLTYIQYLWPAHPGDKTTKEYQDRLDDIQAMLAVSKAVGNAFDEGGVQGIMNAFPHWNPPGGFVRPRGIQRELFPDNWGDLVPWIERARSMIQLDEQELMSARGQTILVTISCSYQDFIFRMSNSGKMT